MADGSEPATPRQLQPHEVYTRAEVLAVLAGDSPSHGAAEAAEARLQTMLDAGQVLPRAIKHNSASATVYYLSHGQKHSVNEPGASGSGEPADKRAKTEPANAAITATPQEQEEAKQRRRELLAQRHRLKARRDKLLLVKTYRTSRDVAQLDDLIEKWRRTAVEVLEELLKLHPDATRAKLMDHYNIPDEMLRYHREDDYFD